MKGTIEQFYSAFSKLHAAQMVALYHPEIVFEYPAFGKLEGERAKNMWRMLCQSQQGKDFQVSYSAVKEGSALWEAHYTFSATGRKVHNKIHAQFEFKDGLIIKHTDYFDLHRWAKQALGFRGAILGWSAYFKKRLQQRTNRMLDRFGARAS